MQSLVWLDDFYLFQWALNILKKPIVTIQWLQQCWNEHRVVPQESYRILPFSGLTISLTRIPAGCYVGYQFPLCNINYLFIDDVWLFFSDERKEIEKLITQNGGTYSADLTKMCTHLISDISFSWFL